MAHEALGLEHSLYGVFFIIYIIEVMIGEIQYHSLLLGYNHLLL